MLREEGMLYTPLAKTNVFTEAKSTKKKQFLTVHSNCCGLNNNLLQDWIIFL